MKLYSWKAYSAAYFLPRDHPYITSAYFGPISNPPTRALPDITSGPEVRQIFKIRTVGKPDVFLPRRRTFDTIKSRRKKLEKKKKKIQILFQIFFQEENTIHTHFHR